jgi:DNA-binding transcriptional regulator YdaS (Cro superfamily)
MWTPAELREAGEELFGRFWQTALARALGVYPQTVRRWAAGKSGIGAPEQKAIEAMLKDSREKEAAR